MTKFNLRKASLTLLFILIVAFVCFLILEVGLRIAFDSESVLIHSDENKLYALNPNIETTLDFPILGINSVPFQTNEYGFNTPSWFENDKEHILIIGDSYVEAAAFGDQAFPYLLQDKLNNIPENNINVISAGVSSYALDNEYKVYEQLLSCVNEYNITHLFLVSFLNDYTDSSRDDIFVIKNNTLVDNTPIEISKIKKVSMYLSKYSITVQVLWKIVTQNQLLMKIATIAGISNQGEKFDYSIIPRGDVPSFLFSDDPQFDNLRTDIYTKVELYYKMFEQTSNINNIKFTVVLIPISEEIVPEDLEKFHNNYGDDLNPTLINTEVENILNNQNISYISVRNQIKTNNKTSLFFDFEQDFHMNHAGQQFLAELLEGNINGKK